MIALDRSFYLRDAKTIAMELLGMRLVRRYNGGEIHLEISETEAYLGTSDAACHSYGDRRTPRTHILYGLGGYAYIYFIYGMYYMLNVVTGEENDPCAVLIRGGIPLKGHDAISENRYGLKYEALSHAQRRSLADGPGKLTKALCLTKEHNGLDFTASELMICNGDPEPFTITATPRIGIDYAGEAAHWPLNFKLNRIRQSRANR